MFFELIQVAVGNRTALSRVPSADEWQEMYALSKEHALQGVLFDAMKRLPSEQQPDSLLAMKWFGITQKIIMKSKRAFVSCEALARDMEKNHKHYVIMKGQGVAMLYPNPSLRVSGDIDIWVEGDRMATIDYIQKKTEVSRIIYHHLEAKLKNDMDVEIHFIPTIMYSYRGHRKLQQYFKRVADREYNHKIILEDDKKIPVAVSTLAFNRVYLLVHIFRHLFAEGIGLRQLMDYYYVLRQGFTEEERKEAVGVLKSLHLLKFASAVMFVQQKVFGLPDSYLLVEPHEGEGRFLLSEIMQAGNFGQFDKRIVREKSPSLWQKFFRPVKRDMRFVFSYPEEALSAPFFKIFHFCWLKYHGWV